MSAPYASRCYSCASLAETFAQAWWLHLAQAWWLHLAQNGIQFCSCTSILFSDYLCSVAFLPQEVCSQPLPPPLLCAGAMRSSQLFSVCTADWHSELSICTKCLITLCWCTKYLSKDNLPLPLLTRKQGNRQGVGEVKRQWDNLVTLCLFCIYV